MLGNTILLKHAQSVPQSALAIEALFADAGAPEGVFTNLFVEVEDIARIVENPLVQGCSLTGSDRAGSAFGEEAGRAVKKVVLELGGSDPFIVLDGDNLERTVEAAFVGRMHNMGQVCTSAKRMIVIADVFQDFVDGLAERMAELEPGDPLDEKTTLAPLSSERAAELVIEQVDDAIEKGAGVVTGGRRIDRPGAFVEPTILVDVTPEMRAYHEELFGPVAAVYRVESDEEAIALANGSQYGLGGAVFGSDGERAQAVADRLEAGMVFVNHPTASEPNLPFGGVKRSGFGRELSHLGHSRIRQPQADRDDADRRADPRRPGLAPGSRLPTRHQPSSATRSATESTMRVGRYGKRSVSPAWVTPVRTRIVSIPTSMPATMSVSMRSPIIAVVSECAFSALSALRIISGFGLPTK